MIKAYLTHNNTYDSAVITNNDEIVCAAQVDKDIFDDFHRPDPEFADWLFGSPYDLDKLNKPEDYGTIYAIRNGDDAEVESINDDLYFSRQEFYI